MRESDRGDDGHLLTSGSQHGEEERSAPLQPAAIGWLPRHQEQDTSNAFNVHEDLG